MLKTQLYSNQVISSEKHHQVHQWIRSFQSGTLCWFRLYWAVTFPLIGTRPMRQHQFCVISEWDAAEWCFYKLGPADWPPQRIRESDKELYLSFKSDSCYTTSCTSCSFWLFDWSFKNQAHFLLISIYWAPHFHAAIRGAMNGWECTVVFLFPEAIIQERDMTGARPNTSLV